jgi:hypothetical protein
MTMLLTAQVLAGSSELMHTKKGEDLPKTRMKLLDIGPEASGGDIYWVDFLGEAALSDDEFGQVHRQQVTIEIRRMVASMAKAGNRAYLNATGGAITFGGQVVQTGLRTPARQKRSA